MRRVKMSIASLCGAAPAASTNIRDCPACGSVRRLFPTRSRASLQREHVLTLFSLSHLTVSLRTLF
jgi:hypothetical protein